jgi:hypothetical protein
VAGETPEGWGPGGRQAHDRAVQLRLRGEGPEIVGGLVHVPLAGHHDEERRAGQEEREEGAGGAGGT